MDSPTKLCHCCNLPKPLSDFRVVQRTAGNPYIKARCRACDLERVKKYQKAHPEQTKKTHDRFAARDRDHRANGLRTEWFIYSDSRGSDRKSGYTNDLTKDFIRDAIKDGCQYCGETTIRMTLDRIDNTKGHTMDNVVPACIRCNYARRSMPYDAWLVVAKGMKEARESGLFGTWTGRVK